MKRPPISAPREDNPRHEFDETHKRVRLICTDCQPEQIVTDRDVSHWEAMPLEMVEKDGELRGVEDMCEWVNHMSKVHGISPAPDNLGLCPTERRTSLPWGNQ